VRRTDQRRGFLVSTIVHLMFLMALSSLARKEATDGKSAAEAPPPLRERVFLPPAEVLRQLVPRRSAPPAPRSAPVPTPPPAQAGKDRMSVGAPVAVRQRGPLELRRDEDLTKVAKGRPDAVPDAAPAPTPPPRTAQVDGGPSAGPGATGGLRLPPGLGTLTAGREGGGRGTTGAGGPQGTRANPIASSLQDLDRRLAQAGALGLPSGTGQQMGPLFFDPEGADFTLWLNQFKNEVYRNWIVPQAAMLGFRGSVDIEFVVERDGRMSSLRMTRSSGTVSLDRAAENALRGSRWLALPADYRPSRVTMRVTFFYNEQPRES
jgi:TonB family protein